MRQKLPIVSTRANGRLNQLQKMLCIVHALNNVCLQNNYLNRHNETVHALNFVPLYINVLPIMANKSDV